MRAAVIADQRVGAADVDDPTLLAGHVLVEVASAGLNAADLLQCAGLYPAPSGVPADIPGLEFAGVVSAVASDVTAVSIGDHVMAVVGGGAQAQRVVVAADHLLAVPANVDLRAAGGFPEAFTTAHDALVTQAGCSAGDRLLVTGAAGGVGTAAVQLGHALGAEVIACARDVPRHAALRELGATTTVTPDDVGDAGPFDVVLELVGAPSLEVIQRHLSPFARVVVIGVGAGATVALNLLNVMSRRVSITGSTLRARSHVEKTAAADGVRRDVLGLLANGQVVVPLQATYALEEVEAAYAAFGTRGKLGKLVLSPMTG
jgi:NADPH:quinone reductase